MKKSNYLHYLKEIQVKKCLQVSKTFKNGKKRSNSHSIKDQNTKVKERTMLPKHGNIQQAQRLEDKENQHPNFIKDNKKQLNPMLKNLMASKIVEGLNLQSNIQAQFKEIRESFKKRKVTQKKIGLGLSKCNFQPSHNSQNLFLVQTLDHIDLIVCEQCSIKFSKRIPLNSFTKQKPKYTYGQLIDLLEKLHLKNKKLNRVMLVQNESFVRTIGEVSAYYGQLIRVILQKKDQLQTVLIGAYNKNEATIANLISKNQQNIDSINRNIHKWEKRCSQQFPDQQGQTKDFEQIDAVIDYLSKNDQFELSCLIQRIPMEILINFQKDFTQSKYCITLSRKSSLQGKNDFLKFPTVDSIPQQQGEIYSQDQDEQIKPIDKDQQEGRDLLDVKNRVNLSPDYQKQIPFNVQYSATTEKPGNFSHKLDDQLSKMSSSQELLIQSLRDHQPYPKLNTNLSAPYIISQKPHDNLYGPQKNISTFQNNQIQKELHNFGKGTNFRTESSTCRTLPPEKTSGKQNFVMHLHADQEDFTDLICDQDLTLSSSHPIHQNSTLPRKSLKLSYNPNKRNERPLTLQQLNSELSQPQKLPQILNPSVISANQNKHEISFELDENMLIDANILPTQEIDQQNLDIISPAFKII